MRICVYRNIQQATHHVTLFTPVADSKYMISFEFFSVQCDFAYVETVIEFWTIAYVAPPSECRLTSFVCGGAGGGVGIYIYWGIILRILNNRTRWHHKRNGLSLRQFRHRQDHSRDIPEDLSKSIFVALRNQVLTRERTFCDVMMDYILKWCRKRSIRSHCLMIRS